MSGKLKAGGLQPMDRLDTLDGMRGVAALMVVIFHFLARWAEPHYERTLFAHGGDIITYFPAISYFGRFGVLLFFLISGFLIMMTLERSTGILDFIGRRAARLWPSMLVCAALSTLIINNSGVIEYYGTYDWEVTPFEFICSIFFVSPALIGGKIGIEDATYVEGVYWTLFYEVRFYFIAALAFLLTPRAWFYWVWAGLLAISVGTEALRASGVDVNSEYTIIYLLLMPKYLCWFSVGIVGYLYWTQRFGLVAMVIGALSIAGIALVEIVEIQAGALVLVEDATAQTHLVLAVFLPFSLFLVRSSVLNVLRMKPMIALGLASYPLYLFHERVGMAAMMYLNEAGIPPWVSVGITTCLAVLAALAIHKIVEMPAKRVLTRQIKPHASGLQTRFGWLQFRAA